MEGRAASGVFLIVNVGRHNMHDRTHLLESLKALRRERSTSSPFGSHIAFLQWSDQVLPLLAFDEKLAAEFKHLVEAATSVETWRPKMYAPNVNNAISCVAQATAALEHAATQVATAPSPAGLGLAAPDKVTAKWLYEHVPLSLVGGGIVLLATAFGLGLTFSETQMYALTKTAIANPSRSSDKQPANTIEVQPKIVSRTASSPQ